MTPTITPERPNTPDALALIAELGEALNDPRVPLTSRHGYSVDKLLLTGVAFFVTRCDGLPAGCGGLQVFEAEGYGEVKRMYVRPAFRGLGLAKLMLEHLTQYAQARGLTLLRLETGIYQTEALGLYQRMGFYLIPAFGEYQPDELSRFFEKQLRS